MRTLDDVKAAAAAEPKPGVREVVLPSSGVFARVRAPSLGERLALALVHGQQGQSVAFAWLLVHTVEMDADVVMLREEDLLLLMRTMETVLDEALAAERGGEHGHED